MTVKEYGNCGQTFNVLQQLCEGHNSINQDLLREQPTHSGDINLIALVCGTSHPKPKKPKGP